MIVGVSSRKKRTHEISSHLIDKLLPEYKNYIEETYYAYCEKVNTNVFDEIAFAVLKRIVDRFTTTGLLTLSEDLEFLKKNLNLSTWVDKYWTIMALEPKGVGRATQKELSTLDEIITEGVQQLLTILNNTPTQQIKRMFNEIK